MKAEQALHSSGLTNVQSTRSNLPSVLRLPLQNLGIVPILLVAILFLIGMGQIVGLSMNLHADVSFREYWEIFSRPDYRATLVRTFLFAAIVTAVSIPIGILCGLFLARTTLPKGPLIALVLAPWMISVVVRSYGWVVVLDYAGILNWMLTSLGIVQTPLQFLFRPLGTIIGLVHIFLPIMILNVFSVALHNDRVYEEASSTLGASPRQTFFLVVLPMLMPGLVTGATVVFVLTCGAVVTPLMLGGIRDAMIGTQIYQDVFQTFNLPKASAMSIILILSTVAVLAAAAVLKRVFASLSNTAGEKQ